MAEWVKRAIPALAAAAALGVYLQTMYPGLVSTGDSPKFQFVGRIWGTPHNPGYPLYVVISHLFSHVPLGTLAYRINLMSAVFGAATVWLMVLIVRRLTGSMAAGAGAALSLAFGLVFWSQATIAEVYTLGSALLATALLLVLRWADTRRPADLLLAVAAFALALGNHLTIVMVAPGLVLFVLATDWRAAVKPRVLIASAAIVLAGLAQYGLILYWTARQPAYLESSARNFRELGEVMRGGQFADRLGNVDLAMVLERNSALLGILVRELGPWGIALALAGLVVLVRRRWTVAALLVAGATGVWLFLLDYSLSDPQVFLIPVFVMAAVASGVVLALLVRPLEEDRRIARRITAAVLALVPAGALLAANYRASDHHRRTYETRLFDAVLRALPDRSVIVPGNFANHLMLTYKLEGERAGAGRDLRQGQPDAAALRALRQSGYHVFALNEAREPLERTGAVLEPVQLWDEPLSQWLDGLPPGRVVAIAGVGFHLAIPNDGGPSLPQVGGRTSLAGRWREDYAIVGITGGRVDALEAVGAGAEVRLDAGRALGSLTDGLPVSVEARSDGGGRIAVGGIEIAAAPGAIALAELTPEGTVVRTGTADPAQQLRVSFAGDPQLFRVVEFRECRDVGNLGWQDVTSMASLGALAVRIDNYRPFDSRILFVVASDASISPVLASSRGPGTPTFTVGGASEEALSTAGFTGAAALAHRHAYVIDIRVNDDGQDQTLGVDFGGPVRAAFASVSVDLNNPRRATLCSEARK